MLDKAILKDKKVIPVESFMVWEEWFETADRIVKQETLSDGKWISTVFLGINHGFYIGEPLWFETMVFPKKNDFLDLDIERYTTWEEAEEGHKRMIKKWAIKKSGRKGEISSK